MIRIISLGLYVVQCGIKGAPYRIKVMASNIGHRHRLEEGLENSRFVPSCSDPEPWRHRFGIEAWPEGQKQCRLAAVNFGVGFPDLAAVLEASNDDALAGLRPGEFPHLQPFLAERGAGTLRSVYGIPRLEVASQDSLWRGFCGGLYTLRLGFLRKEPLLDSAGVEFGRVPSDWFLFVES